MSTSPFLEPEINLQKSLMELIQHLWQEKKLRYNRLLPLGEYLSDRHVKAKLLNSGEGTTLYDTSVVLGDVKIGAHTFIGPFVVLDGTGGLNIGSYCSISAGVQIYTHDTVAWAISGGKAPYEYQNTIIEDNCYIGPNTIIQKGVIIGRGSIIGANSFVNCSIPQNSKVAGNPAKSIQDEEDL